jgi:hypothetical protein
MASGAPAVAPGAEPPARPVRSLRAMLSLHRAVVDHGPGPHRLDDEARVTVARLGHRTDRHRGYAAVTATPSRNSAAPWPSTRGRRLPIRRSDPGPITRAGVVSLWARGRTWREDPPLGSRRIDPGVPTMSLAGEKPPRHPYTERALVLGGGGAYGPILPT